MRLNLINIHNLNSLIVGRGEIDIERNGKGGKKTKTCCELLHIWTIVKPVSALDVLIDLFFALSCLKPEQI